MIHQVADNDVSKTDKQPDAAQKPKHPDREGTLLKTALFHELSPCGKTCFRPAPAGYYSYRDALPARCPPTISTGMYSRATRAMTSGIQLSE